MSASGRNADIASPSLSSRHHDRRDSSDSITTRAWALSADPQGRPVVCVPRRAFGETPDERLGLREAIYAAARSSMSYQFGTMFTEPAEGATFVRDPWLYGKPERSRLLMRPADKFRLTTIVFDLFGNNQLEVY
jgi:hypothetical protein